MKTPETKTMMTSDDYSALRLTYGADLSAWPDAARRRAEKFLAIPLGRQTEAAEAALDALLAAPVVANPNDASAFLNRLKDIPAEQAMLADSQPDTSLLQVVLNTARDWFSPAGLVSQGVAFALVLGVGIMVGLQSEAEFSGSDLAADANGSYDLSAQLFASGSELYLEDE